MPAQARAGRLQARQVFQHRPGVPQRSGGQDAPRRVSPGGGCHLRRGINPR